MPAETPLAARRSRGQPISQGKQCIASGHGLHGGTAGVVAHLTVKCKDAQGNQRTKGDDVVLVSIQSEDGVGGTVDAHVVDNTDGTYTCTYLPTTATARARVTITVNGTHINGSPFFAQVEPGRTYAQSSECYGRGLFDGMSGQLCRFHIQTKDSYGNRCTTAGEKFMVCVKAVSSLVPELEKHLKQYEPPAVVTDNEDGSHTVEYTCDYAGFYRIDVTMDSTPVGASPYNACICNATIAFPPTVIFYPLQSKNESSLPCRPSRDYAVVQDTVVVLKSDPISATSGRREREAVHYYKLTQHFDPHWKETTIRGALSVPPPTRRQAVAMASQLVLLCHSDPTFPGEEPVLGPIDDIRMLDLSTLGDSSTIEGWSRYTGITGRAPAALEGYAVCVWEGKRSVLVSGGVDAQGRLTNDIFLLGLSAPGNWTGYWRTLQEWPNSIFHGDACCPRRDHTMTFRQDTASFWIFGGRGADGSLLNDLYVFDLVEEMWSQPQSLNDLPQARYGHSACFVADRYLVIYGGYGADGAVIDSAAVYDAITAMWTKVSGVNARADHKLVNRCGILYVMGGVDKDGAPAPLSPFQSETFPFKQSSCLDFLGNHAQAVFVKPSPSILALRNAFTVEAVVLARSFGSGYAPIITKTDAALKQGWGLLGLEHPAFKGDPLEGPMVHFFVGNWSGQTTGGGQECHVKIEYNKWCHIMATFDGIELKIYVDGTFTHQFEYSMSEEEAESLVTKNELTIGAIAGRYAWDGFIDEVRLWSSCINADHATDYMNKPYELPATGPSTQPTLIGQWTFNEGTSADLVVDSSGYRNHASFERYAGGIELRRVQSRRGTIAPKQTQSEKWIDDNWCKLQEWKKAYEERNGRLPTKADMMLAEPEIKGVANMLGEFQ